MGDSLLLDWEIDHSDRVGPQLLRILRKQIISGGLTPGTRLSESDIAAKFSVSRQPVREAFIKLADEGLLEVRPQRGSYVLRISLKAVNDARFVREAIEADIVKLLANTPNPSLAKELRDQIQVQETAIGEPARFIELDDVFHRTLAEAADRRHAWQVIVGLKVQLDRVRYFNVQRFPMAQLVNQHREIAKQIEIGSAENAELALRVHLNAASSDLPLIAAENPEYFQDLET